MLDKIRKTAPSSDYERIAVAMDYLERNRTGSPRLRDVAEAVGLSEFHFQRLFTRWAGISPKRFSQVLTISHARALLRQSSSVLQVSHDVGLSGAGRLHDLFVTIDAVTPGEYKRGGAGLCIEYGEHDSPFGQCLIGATGRGICWLSFTDASDPHDGLSQLRATWPAAELVRKPQATANIAARAFAPRRRMPRQPLRILLGGTNFQLKVWEALIRIPPGRLVTYGDIAAAIGHPDAPRAVGNAVAANRVSFLIPCHRVIRNLGIVGHYRWGRTRKKALIAWESTRYANPRATSLSNS